MPTVTKYKNCAPCEEKRRARAAQLARDEATEAEAREERADREDASLRALRDDVDLRRDQLRAAASAPGPGAPVYTRPPLTDAPSEYAQHLKRQGAVYSEGHRRIYSSLVELLGGTKLARADVLEVGMGIGYGLGQMLKGEVLRSYQGLEPDPASYSYAADKWSQASESVPGGVMLYNLGLLAALPVLRPAPFVFCVEVVEHVPAGQIERFLAALRALTTQNLFLSTPDATTSRHGVATTDEWKRALRAAGFDVATVARQWTTLFVCEPV
jgi:hypothetical protein